MEILSDDSVLWQAFKEGDKNSFKIIYFKYFTNLYEYGMRISGDSEIIKDTIHDLFVKLWKNKANLGDVTSLRAYLLVALRRALYNNLQKSSRKPVVEISENAPFEMVFSVESDYIKKESASAQNQKLKNALDSLTPRQKEVIYLRYFEEMDYSDIAPIMNITVKAVYKLTARGLETLRQIIKSSGTSFLSIIAITTGKILLFRILFFFNS
jgi:RNA polymerase sigma factor (sigma-70 family)